MIYEEAILTIDVDNASEFEAAVAQAVPLFKRAEGCHEMSLDKVIETPGEYRLRVAWESVEAHMDTFRNSDDFQAWRELVGGYFKQAPTVVHTASVARYF